MRRISAWSIFGACALLAALPGCPSPRGGCARNSDCARGAYCSAGACVTDCTPATVADDCEPGQMCNTFGMCVGGALDAGLDGGPPADAPDAPTLLDAPLDPDAPAPADGGEDDAPLPFDAGPEDGGPEDAGLLDAGPPDAGRADAPDAPSPPLTGTLVINEVDYDQPSTDNAEFVEIYNGGATVADLTGLAVVFINGTGSAEYARASLSGMLAPGAYLVVGVSGQTLSLPGGVGRFDIGVGIQNGAPDGLALWDTVRMVAIDVLSYEGAITAAVIDGVTVNLVEGTATALVESNTVPDSLCRRPNGRDTNDAGADWMLCTTPTPGGPN